MLFLTWNNKLCIVLKMLCSPVSASFSSTAFHSSSQWTAVGSYKRCVWQLLGNYCWQIFVSNVTVELLELSTSGSWVYECILALCFFFVLHIKIGTIYDLHIKEMSTFVWQTHSPSLQRGSTCILMATTVIFVLTVLAYCAKKWVMSNLYVVLWECS